MPNRGARLRSNQYGSPREDAIEDSGSGEAAGGKGHPSPLPIFTSSADGRVRSLVVVFLRTRQQTFGRGFRGN